MAFAAALVERCRSVRELEQSLKARTGRKRDLSVRALLVALLVLAMDDRPLHLWGATKLLYRSFTEAQKVHFGMRATAASPSELLARYRCVRYLFHKMCAQLDPKGAGKDRDGRSRHGEALERFVNDLLDSSVALLSKDELQNFDGSVGLDATVVPLFSRGPSLRSARPASDPDGGWYVRTPDRREIDAPNRKRRTRTKIVWALEATIATMAQPPGAAPAHPNLAIGFVMERPGEDPGGTGVRVLPSVARRGYRPGSVGADRGYTQADPERFHLPARPR